MNDLAKLLAVLSINNSKARYARGADLQDGEVFASAFTQDAVWDLRGWAVARYGGTGDWNGTGSSVPLSVLESLSDVSPWPISGREAIRESAQKLTTGAATFHQMSNPEIEFLSDHEASVVWPFEDTLHFPEGFPIRHFNGLGRYVETYAPDPEDNAWKIKTCRVLRFAATIV